MTAISTNFPHLSFIEPNPEIHAPITLGWFTAEYGDETLLLMGNAEHEIEEPSLESELQTLQEFVDMKKSGEQLTWMIVFDELVIGVAWIELVENHNVQPPSIHLMIGNKEYRGKGIGKATMLAMVEYSKNTLHASTVYSRHLTSNAAVAAMNNSLGFEHDGSSYVDENNLEWQNVSLKLN